MADYKKLTVYQKAFKLSMEVFQVSKNFPKEERYALIDQMRRSSRSVCANLAEAYRKRKYPAHFVSKLTDCDMENSETRVWLDFALECNYLDETLHAKLYSDTEEIGKLLFHMINYPEKYGAK